MSVTEYDVIIIGAGVSGLTAGALLAGRGYRVALVTKGEPTACLSTGCVDVCSRDDNPLSGIRNLPAEHPYHLVPEKTVIDAMNYFKTAMKDVGLPYAGEVDKNRVVMSALGTSKVSCLVPSTMESAPQGNEESIHIVTFRGLKDFYPGYIVSRHPHTRVSVYDAGTASTMSIAAQFEDKTFFEKFVVWLQKLNIEEDKIAFPAVLGMESAAGIVESLAGFTGKQVFEIPTIPPSMPGRRLFNALKENFRRKGGTIYWAWPVEGIESAGSLIEAVTTHSEGRPNNINARAFILATGSFVGGGLTATRTAVVENVFHLPVHVTGPRDTWFDNDYFSMNHGIGKAGIITDATLRPKDSHWKNIFVCGGILADTDILKNGCGHGLALATAHLADQTFAEYLSHEV